LAPSIPIKALGNTSYSFCGSVSKFNFSSLNILNHWKYHTRHLSLKRQKVEVLVVKITMIEMIAGSFIG
jgi:hypothetical protein